MEEEIDAKERSEQWLASGIIVTGGLAHLVSLHRSLLVMDVKAWARSQSEAHQRDAVTATSESARERMVMIARDLRRWADGDRDFLESGTTLWQCSVSIAIRAKMEILKVTESNFAEFIAQIMSRTMPVQRSIPPSFLFVAEASPPELYVTQDSEYMAKYAAEGIHRQVVSKRALLALYDEVLKDYRLAHEVARESRKNEESEAHLAEGDAMYNEAAPLSGEDGARQARHGRARLSRRATRKLSGPPSADPPMPD